MAKPLPRLRTNLEFMQSPFPDQPGLLIRDLYRYSDKQLILPPVLVECLACFDGEQTELDLRARLVQVTEGLQVGEMIEQLTRTLSDAGFLEDMNYQRMMEERWAAFAEAAAREPVHAGQAYPDDEEELRARLDGFLEHRRPRQAGGRLLGIAAPHIALEGGGEVYGAAFGVLGEEQRDRVFVILGTSHYGEPDRFGLTRKPFRTPLGETVTETRLVDRLEERGGEAVAMEDYCHAIEHSIEFQVLFLQHLYGPGVRILPILCGSFGRSVRQEGLPEEDEGVRRFLEALRETAGEEGEDLFWVLGIDMAHMGRRYGDPLEARADEGGMLQVAERDRARIEQVLEGDGRGFWERLSEEGPDLKWCGSSALYAFLWAAPGARGELLAYRQWNIDLQSVVSFAALAFSREG